MSSLSDRMLLAIAAGIAMLATGLLALWFPVLLDSYDGWGWQIDCGTGYSADLGQAVQAGAQYVGDCGTALLIRRLWAIPLAVAGWLLLTVLTLRWMFDEPMVADAPEVSRDRL